MKRSFLVLLALTLITAGPALADCHPGHTAGCDAKASMAPCGGAPGCGGVAAGCGPSWVARGSAGTHVSHDPGHVWYRGPAPSSTLFGEMKGGCGSPCGAPRVIKIRRNVGGAPCGSGAMAPCGTPCGTPCATPCGSAAKTSACAKPCGTVAKAGACGTPCTPAQMAACGTACGSASSSACAPARVRATHSCCGAPAKAGCWHTSWKAKPTSTFSGCCGG